MTLRRHKEWEWSEKVLKHAYKTPKSLKEVVGEGEKILANQQFKVGI